jgi:hypothetical protein
VAEHYVGRQFSGAFGRDNALGSSAGAPRLLLHSGLSHAGQDAQTSPRGIVGNPKRRDGWAHEPLASRERAAAEDC